jgi:hypothetical protein
VISLRESEKRQFSDEGLDWLTWRSLNPRLGSNRKSKTIIVICQLTQHPYKHLIHIYNHLIWKPIGAEQYGDASGCAELQRRGGGAGRRRFVEPGGAGRWRFVEAQTTSMGRRRRTTSMGGEGRAEGAARGLCRWGWGGRAEAEARRLRLRWSGWGTAARCDRLKPNRLYWLRDYSRDYI